MRNLAALWAKLRSWMQSWLTTPTRLIGATIAYTGIATVFGPSGFQAPVYRHPRAAGNPVGFLRAGQYAPHFNATPDLAWLQVTLQNGGTGWLQNNPAHVTVTLPDPTKVRVVVDPGHGGSDTGAVGNGLVEKHLNFDIAFWHLGTRLSADSRIDRVWFTRTADEDVSLAYRSALANASGASLFVSVHNNSHLSTSRGTETYYKCGSEAGVPVRTHSRRAACLTHLRLREQIILFGSSSCPWVDRGVICRLISQSDPRSYYYVLRNTIIAAILAECLFISNPNEAQCLGNHDFIDAMGQALYNGITDFLFTTLPGDTCDFRTYYGL